MDNKATCCTDIRYYFQQSPARISEKQPAHLLAPLCIQQFQLASDAISQKSYNWSFKTVNVMEGICAFVHVALLPKAYLKL